MKFFIAIALLCLFAVTFGHQHSGHGGEPRRYFINAPRNVFRDHNLPACKQNLECPSGSFCDVAVGHCRKTFDGKK